MNRQRFQVAFPTYILAQAGRNQDTGAEQLATVLISELTMPNGDEIQCLPLFVNSMDADVAFHAAFQSPQPVKLAIWGVN